MEYGTAVTALISGQPEFGGSGRARPAPPAGQRVPPNPRYQKYNNSFIIILRKISVLADMEIIKDRLCKIVKKFSWQCSDIHML